MIVLGSFRFLVFVSLVVRVGRKCVRGQDEMAYRAVLPLVSIGKASMRNAVLQSCQLCITVI